MKQQLHLLRPLLLGFTLLMLTFSVVEAQQYTPMLKETARWIFVDESSNQEYAYYLGKDTTVNGKIYSKLILQYYDEFTWPYEFSESVALVREDIAQQKVYFIPDSFGNELLLFDFTATTGDTVTLEMPDYDAGLNTTITRTFVVGGDTVFPSDNVRTLSYDEVSGGGSQIMPRDFSMAEGVGVFTDHLSPLLWVQDWEEENFKELRCYLVADSNMYPVGWSCDSMRVAIQEPFYPASAGFEVHDPILTPNQLSFMATAPATGSAEVNLVNMQGQVLQRQEVKLISGEQRVSFPIKRPLQVRAPYILRVVHSQPNGQVETYSSVVMPQF